MSRIPRPILAVVPTFDFTTLIDGVSRTHTVRVVTMAGKPWFVAADCIRVLGLDVSSTSKHLAKLNDDEQRVLKRTRRGEAPSEDYRNRLLGELGHRIPMLSLISESGLYRLFNRSDKPQAKPFQDWVNCEVLPSIRKHGAYALAEGETMPLPADLSDALEDHAKTQVKLAVALREKAQAEVIHRFLWPSFHGCLEDCRDHQRHTSRHTSRELAA